MDDLRRVGGQIRAVRVHRGWTQQELADRANVHRSLVSRIERGQARALSLVTLLDVAAALDMRISVKAWWRAGDLERLVNGRHSLLHESVARYFADRLPAWALAPEVSFAVYAERGVIDILAWHPGTRALLVIELKTDIVDVNELIGTLDRKRRHAAEVARARGWDPVTVSCWVIVAGGRTNRARVAAHRTMLRNAFPEDGRTMRTWLRRPDHVVSGLSLWDRADPDRPVHVSGGLASRHRVRHGGRATAGSPSGRRPPRHNAHREHVIAGPEPISGPTGPVPRHDAHPAAHPAGFGGGSGRSGARGSS